MVDKYTKRNNASLTLSLFLSFPSSHSFSMCIYKRVESEITEGNSMLVFFNKFTNVPYYCVKQLKQKR